MRSQRSAIVVRCYGQAPVGTSGFGAPLGSARDPLAIGGEKNSQPVQEHQPTIQKHGNTPTDPFGCLWATNLASTTATRHIETRLGIEVQHLGQEQFYAVEHPETVECGPGWVLKLGATETETRCAT